MSEIRSKKAKKEELSIEQQEAALREVIKIDKTKQRITIDLPKFVYDQVKEEIEMTGQTIKGFVMGLVRDHFTRKDQQ